MKKIGIPDSAQEANREFNEGRLIIAENCAYSLNDNITRLNNNVIVVGGSGTGKSYNIAEPNIHLGIGSYVICDPKGNQYQKNAEWLREQGYDVQPLDFTHPDISTHYNPLSNIRSTQDILKIADIIVYDEATVKSRADPFWDSMATMLVSAIISYMIETNYHPRNFSSILKLMREGERNGEDSKVSMLSARFEALKSKNPDSWAYAQFENVNQCPQRTFDCIRASLAAKFAKFDTLELQKMMGRNDISFSSIGMEKTALFVTVSDTDRSMDSLVNIFFTQAMNTLCDFADNKCIGQRLPVPVRFVLDDFATNCRIEEFPRMISSIRSRGISVMLLIQSESQLRQSYEFDVNTILSNCDTYVYLGGNDIETAQAISLRCDKSLKQILYMPVGACWVFRRGSEPVYTSLMHIINNEKEDAIR